MTINLEALLPQVVTIAQDAGKAIMEIYLQADFGTTYKDDNSPLTQADLVAHQLIMDRLHHLDPVLPVLSEESKTLPYSERQPWNASWLVDPIDGTREFIKRNGEFTVNIALIVDHVPLLGVVHAPALQTTYFAAQGIPSRKQVGNGTAEPIHTRSYQDGYPLKVVASRSHAGPETEAYLERITQAIGPLELLSIGSSLKFCLVAEGSAHLYPRFGPTMEWDTGAAQCVVEQSGGTVTTMQGERLLYNREQLLNPYFMVSGSRSFPWQKFI